MESVKTAVYIHIKKIPNKSSQNKKHLKKIPIIWTWPNLNVIANPSFMVSKHLARPTLASWDSPTRIRTISREEET